MQKIIFLWKQPLFLVYSAVTVLIIINRITAVSKMSSSPDSNRKAGPWLLVQRVCSLPSQCWCTQTGAVRCILATLRFLLASLRPSQVVSVHPPKYLGLASPWFMPTPVTSLAYICYQMMHQDNLICSPRWLDIWCILTAAATISFMSVTIQKVCTTW